MPDTGSGEVIIKFTVRSVNREVKKIRSLTESMEELEAAIKKIEKTLPALGKLVGAISAMGMFNKEIGNLATALNKISASKVQQTAQAMNQSRVATMLFGQSVAKSMAQANNSFTRFSIAASASLDRVGNMFVSAGQGATRFFHYLGRFASRSLFTLMVSLRGVSQAIQQFGSVIRMVGQGLQNFGMTMTFFLAVPLTAVFKSATSAAVAFDDALVKIRKTTNMTWDEIGRTANAVSMLSTKFSDLDSVDLTSISTDLGTMSGALLEMARYTPTPIEDLAMLAEEAGRLGIRGTDDIMAFVQAANMIGVATDISANDAIRTFARLLNASGDLRDESGELMDTAGQSIMRLASTVNYLENTTMGSASNITDAMERMISSSAQFNIPIQNLAAFAATLYELGLTAETAGTTFERITTYMAVNVEKLATMTGQSVGELRNQMDTDFTGALLGVLDAFRNVESQTEASGLAWEIFGVRAQRGVALLSEAYERLYSNLTNANSEFSSGTSLVDEYFEALGSTQSQMEILQNNFKVAAIILGQQFLPTINQAIQLVVAAIQLLAEAWSKLSNRQKLLYVGFAALGIVIPPIAIALGSVMFVIGMFVSAVGGLIGAFVSLGGIITNFAIPALATLTGAMILIPDAVTDIMTAFDDTMGQLMSEAASWGSGIVQQIAQGILNGISWVVHAAYQVASVIASFFRPGSPPETGPLSTIDTWGIGLANMILLGFNLADFSILDTAGRYISGFFEAFGIGGGDKNALNTAILSARDRVKELIDIFNRTGEISQAILSDISSLFGDIGQHVADLLEAQLLYNRELERQAEIEALLDRLNQRREDVLDTYDEEIAGIAASGASAAERVAAFRDARNERDDSLDIVDEEIDAAQNSLDIQRDAVDSARDQVDWQQALLDALLEEARLRRQINDEQRSSIGELADYAGALGDIDWDLGLGDPPDTEAIFEDLEAQIDGFKGIIDEARIAVLTFWAALTGQAPPDEALADLANTPLTGPYDTATGMQPTFDNQLFQNAYEVGSRINEIWTDIKETFENIAGPVGELVGKFGEFKETINETDYGPLQGIFDRIDALNLAQLLLLVMLSLRLLSVFSAIGESTGFLLIFGGKGLKGIGSVVKNIGTFAGVLWGLAQGKALADLVTLPAWITGIGSALGTTIPILGISVGWFLVLAAAIGALVFAIIKFGPQAWENLKGILSNIGIILGEVWNRVKEWTSRIIKHISGKFISLAGKIKEDWNVIKQAIGDKIREIASSIKTWFQNYMRDAFSKLGIDYDSLLERWRKIGDDIGLILQALKDKIKQWVLDAVTDLAVGLYLVWQDIVGFGTMIIDGIVEGLTTAWNAISTFFTENWYIIADTVSQVWEALLEAGRQIIAAILLGINEVIGTVVEVFGPLVQLIADEVVKFVTSIYEAGKSLIQGLIDGIRDMTGDAIEGVTTLVEKIIAAVKEWLGISSPSKVFIDIGKDIVQGIIDGIVNLWTSLTTKGEELITEFVDWFEDIYEKVVGKVEEVIDEVLRLFNDFKDSGIATFLSNLASNFETTFETIKTTITGILKGAMNTMLANVESAINTIIRGVNEVGGLIMRLPGADALLGGIFPIGLVSLPRLATGGIIMSPITAIVGDAPGGEAVIPLRQLPSLIADSYEEIGPQQMINIRIDRVDARDKDDIDDLVDRISRELGRRAKMGSRLGVSVTMG